MDLVLPLCRESKPIPGKQIFKGSRTKRQPAPQQKGGRHLPEHIFKSICVAVPFRGRTGTGAFPALFVGFPLPRGVTITDTKGNILTAAFPCQQVFALAFPVFSGSRKQNTGRKRLTPQSHQPPEDPGTVEFSFTLQTSCGRCRRRKNKHRPKVRYTGIFRQGFSAVS